MNIASRLCADAHDTEIVIDDAVRSATELDGAAARRADEELKGFGVTRTYAVAD